jgi:hypothetical protein
MLAPEKRITAIFLRWLKVYLLVEETFIFTSLKNFKESFPKRK